MSKPPDYPREIIQKTALAALKGYAAAFATQFQNQQKSNQITALFSPPHQLLISDGQFMQKCCLPESNTRTAVSEQSDNDLTLTFRNFTQEMIRLSSRITKPLLDCVHRDLFPRCTNHLTRPACTGLFQYLRRQRADSTRTLIHSMRSRSTFSVADEEYSFRRITRQRVFHEKGNAG
ncbi:hypothetical protein PM8797T_06942 [Gimesia maris DSM 8797]|uniref:Uncharacterized protein n=1 Tax=Gimesia maris TaxID=122 RepID=A0ABX5YFX8_9PLAN|nr:hypothetical protein PM8797T_06942 [Gimesia maris DSM 8797]QDT77036.1 hypothetical protein Mal35_04610 [Gimesia maris]QDU12676.1 hypothetical protein CA11_04560 [Gimesia maris]QEG14613.1 hypothetical protein GmarT_04490 [Gimesia maris]|tara:strand:+ start:314215 stop:314745 length:531 start_codon:yes stop_codon:yes gene_type:complete